MGRRINIKGKRFNKLFVLFFLRQKDTHAIWKVKCDCGKEFEVSYSNLSSGNTTACASCGHTTHGMKGTTFYRRWLTLKERHKNNISKEWESFINFKNDTHESFKEKYSLRRIHSNEDYSKENCYWSVPSGNKNIKNERIFF